MKRWGPWLVISCIILFLGLAENDKAPDFVLEDLKGNKVTLQNLAGEGNIVVLSFFDTKCEPCVREVPKLKKIFSKYEGKGVKVRLISIDEKGKKVVEPYIKRYRINIPVLLDPLGYRAGERYGVVSYGRASIPQLFVIGKAGKIRRKIKGYEEKLEEILEKEIEVLKKEKLTITRKEKKVITILYTSSANGYLESCECPENPFGGLIRRAAYIQRERKKSPSLLLLDSGDNFSPYANKALSPYILSALSMMDYDAIGIGDQEFINGVEYFNTLRDKEEYRKLPFLCANMKYCDKKLCWYMGRPYLIKVVKGIRIGITSITSAHVFTLFPRNKIQGLDVEDHYKVLQELIPELRPKVGLLILISHSGFDEDREIAQKVRGIDIIVGGHSQTTLKAPAKVGETLILQPGEKGQFVGKLRLFFKDNKLESYKNNLVALTKDIEDDPGVKELINQYNNSVKQETEKLLIK